MADGKYYPDGWREYCAHCKERGVLPDRAWAIFASRFRIAGNFGGSTWFGMAENTTRGYDAAFRLLLSYGAIEAACAAKGRKLSTIRLEGEYLSKCRRQVRISFRSYSAEEFNLRASLTSTHLKRKLSEFFSGHSDDLMPFASAIRHLFAHGIWTPKGSKALTKGATEALDWISHALKLEAQQLFQDFLSCGEKGAPDTSV